METNALLFIACIIFFSKLISHIFQKISIPPVLSMILIGLLIGPSCLDLIKHEDLVIIKFFAQIGVLTLLFMAGLETDLDEIKAIGKNAFLIALGGVILPFLAGFGLTILFFKNLYSALIMGLILTATSVSVSVMTLMDLGKIKTVEGRTIVSAAIIDDIIGIVLLSLILGFIGSDANGMQHVLITIAAITGYFFLVILIGFLIIPKITGLIGKVKSQMIVLSFAFFIMFCFAWLAEKLEIAAITGAFFAGLFIARTPFRHTIEQGVNTIGHTLFISVFFVTIGLQTNLMVFDPKIIMFLIPFIILALGSKLIGSGGIARLLGFGWKRSYRIGCGMMPRGEVALIIASLAVNRAGGLIGDREFTSVIIMVIITAVLTPIFIKLGFTKE